MIKANRVRNSTSLDEAALKYGLIRESNESVDDFFKRTLKACSFISVKEKDSFYKSLGYLTKLQDKDIFLINKLDTASKVRLVITTTELKIYDEDVEVFSKLLSDIKYLRNFKEELEALDAFEVDLLEDNWELLRAENLMPVDSSRHYLTYETDNYQSLLPESDIEEIKDYNGRLTFQTTNVELINGPEFYLQEEELFIKGSRGYDQIAFSYQDFPLKIKWLPIKAIPLNEDSFENIAKDQAGNLTQKGAKIYNKILEKQNTYWGK